MTVEVVTTQRWRDTVDELLGSGHEFRNLHATQRDGEPEVRAAFARGAQLRTIAARPVDGVMPTMIDLVPAATWDEREAADLAAVRFDGGDARPLVLHPDRLDAWTTPVGGHDTHQVVVGPIHAGIIESGHFRFHVVGERILHLDTRLFYKHRGLERAAVGATLDRGLAYVQRACAACAVANAVAYAHACEEALGLDSPAALAIVRTVLLELERVYNHLNDIGASCAGIGFAPGAMRFAALKEDAQRVNDRLAGHRFLFDAVQVGRSSIELGREDAAHLRRELADVRVAATRAWRELQFNTSVQRRFDGVGVLDRDAAVALGTVGPSARASGVAVDQRTCSPRLTYDGFAPATLDDPAGDVRARVELRMLELEASLDLLDALLGPIEPVSAEPAGGPELDIGVGLVESPRGRTFCSIERSGDQLDRVRLRTASYANWSAVAAATPGNILPEFPLINKSFELCYACCDR